MVSSDKMGQEGIFYLLSWYAKISFCKHYIEGLYFRNFQSIRTPIEFQNLDFNVFVIFLFLFSNHQMRKKTMTSSFAKHPQLLQIDILSSIIQYTSQSNWSDHLMKNGPLINLCFKRAVKQQGDQFCTSTVQRWSRLSPLLDRTINQTEEARYKWELSKSAKQRWTANI